MLASQEHSGEIATVTIDQRKYFCQQLIYTINHLQVWHYASVPRHNGTTVRKALERIVLFKIHPQFSALQTSKQNFWFLSILLLSEKCCMTRTMELSNLFWTVGFLV